MADLEIGESSTIIIYLWGFKFMIFYVNQIVDAEGITAKPTEDVIGLFTSKAWSGEGNCCGWYSKECFINTTLLAYYTIPNDGSIRDYRKPYTDFKIVNKKYPKVWVYSSYATEELVADSAEDAIELFRRQTW